MDKLDIPYAQEAGLRTPSSNIWFKLPFARNNAWEHICLRLGKPGNSHIRYDKEGVVLTYTSVEDDSVKRLVADIQRLSNARTFALGMRELLVVRSDEKIAVDPMVMVKHHPE
ncbi:hypothetical protein QVD17_27001 [Tagetes erecta]|uniref:Uncharacterized protein n=1 Tax=Tagetes erecta TaxID=13708 RepID=A0AAD8KCB1_TARER|nr:hypothetical protein QVD17_27001 [Tagetes erecta]